MLDIRRPDWESLPGLLGRLLTQGQQFQRELVDRNEPALTAGQFEAYLSSIAVLWGVPWPGEEDRAQLVEMLRPTADDLTARPDPRFLTSLILPQLLHAEVARLREAWDDARDPFLAASRTRKVDGAGLHRVRDAHQRLRVAEARRDEALAGVPAVTAADRAETERLLSEQHDRLRNGPAYADLVADAERKIAMYEARLSAP